jgi:hypothetical protein
LKSGRVFHHRWAWFTFLFRGARQPLEFQVSSRPTPFGGLASPVLCSCLAAQKRR